MGLAYLHVLKTTIHRTLRAAAAAVQGAVPAGGGFTKESGNATLASGGADFIVFGKLFTSNPDLPVRFEKSAALVDPDPNTFYGGGETGYITYSLL